MDTSQSPTQRVLQSDPHRSALLMSIYTLTPTHCGSGQAASAVDLPIQREAHTGFPVIPAPGLKGALRSALEPDGAKDLNGTETLNRIFGPELAPGSNGVDEAPKSKDRKTQRGFAGSLTFGEAQLLLYPGRSLTRVFLYVTSPLILERLSRNLRAFGLDGEVATRAADAALAARRHADCAWVADAALAPSTLVIEDLVFTKDKVRHEQTIAQLATALSEFVADAATSSRVTTHLVVLPDGSMCDLLLRAVPVQARVKLNTLKTTDRNPEDPHHDKGNLWYEEALPPDCLFAAFVGTRPSRTIQGARQSGAEPAPRTDLNTFAGVIGGARVVQIGGNETVGYGFCAVRSAIGAPA